MVNLHRCLSIIASSLSPVRPPSNQTFTEFSLTKIFISLISSPKKNIHTHIYKVSNNYNYHNPNNVSTSLFPATLNWQPPISLSLLHPSLDVSHNLLHLCPAAHVVIIPSPFPRCSFNVTSYGHFHYAQPFINSVALAYIYIYSLKEEI